MYTLQQIAHTYLISQHSQDFTTIIMSLKLHNRNALSPAGCYQRVASWVCMIKVVSYVLRDTYILYTKLDDQALLTAKYCPRVAAVSCKQKTQIKLM